MRIFAERHNRKAIELEESGNGAEAIRLYRKAIDSDASWSAPWFNLGLLYKRQGQWNESFECYLKAVALHPSDEDAWWNLGIAATALENWPEARRAWRASGIPLDEDDGPVELNFGLTPVRLNPGGEVVWCDRIDPARAVIRSIPLPESGRRYGDLLLHDGEPQGYRVLGGVELPVFNELQILRRSDYGTFEIHLDCPDEFETGELIDFLDASGMPAEEWSSSVRSICRACSEGLPPDAGHTHPPDTDGSIRIGIAAKSETELRRALSGWVESHPETKIFEFI